MLHVLEHLLDTVDRTSTIAGQFVQAEKAGTPLAPATLAYYEQQLADLQRQREQMRGLIARWWTLLEEPQWSPPPEPRSEQSGPRRRGIRALQRRHDLLQRPLVGVVIRLPLAEVGQE